MLVPSIWLKQGGSRENLTSFTVVQNAKLGSEFPKEEGK